MAIHPHLPGFAALGMVYFVPPGGDGNGESGSDGCWDQWSGGHQVLLGQGAGAPPPHFEHCDNMDGLWRFQVTMFLGWDALHIQSTT